MKEEARKQGLRFRKHGSVHGAFGREFVKTGLLDAKYHRWLLDAFDKRLQADSTLARAASASSRDE